MQDGRGSGPLGKLKVAIGFHQNTDMDTPREAIGPNPKGTNCVSREVHTVLCMIDD